MTGPSQRAGAQRTERTGPEWVTFGVSAVILVVVVATLVILSFQTSLPAEPVARPPGITREVEGQFFVPVDIVNRGDEGAAEVQVLAELTIDGQTTSGDQVVDFLGGGEVQALTFAFADDPTTGELTISVSGFAAP